MRVFTYIVLIIVVVFGLTFACLNIEAVTVNYYLGAATLPLSMLLAFTFVVGGLAGLMATLKNIIKLKHECRGLRQRLKIAEKEIENLRVMPLKDTH